MTRIVFGLMWLARLLPPWMLARVGDAAGWVAFWLIPERRQVTRKNLALCLPDLPPPAREQIARAHFRAFCRSFVERGVLWWSSRSRIARMVRLEGVEHLRALRGQPVILFVPHFVALDAAMSRLSPEFDMVAMYAQQKDPLFAELLVRGRTRFGDQQLVSRQHGIRGVVGAIRRGRPFFYLPDLDFGPRHALFVPFFGVPAATVPGLSRIARATGARVLPCVTRLMPQGGCVVTIDPPWEDFPTEDPVADTRRMNAWIEARIATMPEQYLWMHKRFKTRPPGEARFY